MLPEVSHVRLTHRAGPRSSGNNSTDQPRHSSASISRRTRSRTVWGTGTRRSRSDGVPSHDDSKSAPLGGLLGYRAFCVWDSEQGSVMKHEGRQGGGCTCVFRGRRCPLPRRAEQLTRTAGQQGQTRRPDQVVVADGRSTDGTREWLEQFQRDRPAGRGQPSTARLGSPESCRRGRRRGCCGPVDAHSTCAPGYIRRL